jgi:glycosyltransferase involved in cell wall biosynthesis
LNARRPEVRAVIVGDGPLESQVKKAAREMGLDGMLTFAGFRPDALRFLRGFDAFCLSSKEEGLGTSIIDAMALGIPVAATAAGGIPELIENNVSGYLAPIKSPVELAAAIEKALAASSKHPEIISNAREKARLFDVSNTVARTEAVYKLSTGLST